MNYSVLIKEEARSLKKYKKLQIIKHALQHYIKRDGANPNDIRTEENLLKEITEEVEELKERYSIRILNFQGDK